MTAFQFHDWHAAVAVLAALGCVLAFGMLTTRLPPTLGRVLSWLLVIVTACGIERLTACQSPILRTVALAAGLIVAFKAVVTVETQADGMPSLPAWQWLCFAGLSVGMSPEAFRNVGGPSRRGSGWLLARAAVHSAMGLGLIRIARESCLPGDSGSHESLWSSALLLAGVCLVFHYGLLTAVAAGWRLLGVPADELHRRPTAARSLTEFWGRRWNLPFAALTARAVYRPLRRRVGPSAALFAAFALSGVLHELAVSVPVRAGFGGPLAYFLLHGVVVLAERRLRPEAWGLAGRAWTAAWLIVPLPLLFHRPFLDGVVWPLAGVP